MRSLTKGALLAIVLLTVNTTLSDWYRERVMWDGIAERTLRQFDERAARVETVILGDSHAKWGLIPGVIGKTFDLAMPGERYSETYYVLKQLLDRPDLHLRHVVLQADLHSFAEFTIDRFAFIHYYAPFVDYWDLGWRRGSPWVYSVRWLFGRYAPYVGERANILSYLDHGQPADLDWLLTEHLESGALLRNASISSLSAEERVERARKRVSLHFGAANPFSPLLAQYFVEILELCKANGLGVTLVEYPVTRDYLDAASERIDVGAFDRKIRDLIAPYPNVHLVAARSAFGDNVDVFLDTDHLNRKGAQKLARLVRLKIREASGSRQSR